MNILILSWRGPNHPKAGGAEVVTHEYAKGWVRDGHRVVLFTSIYPRAKKEEIIEGVKIIRSGGEAFGSRISAFLWYLFNSHEDFDLVFDHFHGIPFFTPLYIRRKKIAFIHEVAKEVWRLNYWPKPFNLIPYVIGTALEPLVFLLYKSIPFWTVSNSTKEDLKMFGIPEKNITVIHNGVNLISVGNVKKDKVPVVTFLGALAKDKGIEIALEVFKILHDKNKEYKFWVIGSGDKGYLKNLETKCEKLDIKEKVKFWGFVSDKEKFNLLAKSHVLINPSKREGWGLVVIEGDSVGTPTVGFNVAGLRDSIVDMKTGIICKENTPQNMAENVLRLLSDQKLYQEMSIEAKEWSQRYNWRESIQKSLLILEDEIK